MHVVAHYFPSGYIRVSNVYRALKMLTPDIDPIPPEVLTEFNLANLFDVSSNTTNYTSHSRASFIA
jgi:ATP-dependent DNA helicase RecG